MGKKKNISPNMLLTEIPFGTVYTSYFVSWKGPYHIHYVHDTDHHSSIFKLYCQYSQSTKLNPLSNFVKENIWSLTAVTTVAVTPRHIWQKVYY